MTTYVYLVKQTILVKANSKEEAEGLLPMYPTGYEGQAHYVREETVELLREEEGELNERVRILCRGERNGLS